MAYILGINGRSVSETHRQEGHGGTHNSSACILKDGNLLAMVEEERFSHYKQYGGFPVESIKYCLKAANISIEEVDHIAVGWDSPALIVRQRLSHFALKGMMWRMPTFSLGFSYYALVDAMHGGMKGALKKSFSKFSAPVTHIPHHLSHASSSFRCSGFENASIINFDGAGETATTYEAKGEKNSITELREWKLPDSLGFYYSGFTEYLGFMKNNDEYKIMGLASYGKPKYNMNNILQTGKGSYKVDPNYFYHFNLSKRKYDYTLLEKKFGPRRPDDDAPITQRHKDIAASCQHQLEKTTINLVDNLLAKTGNKNLCIAGGVGLNCVMNGKILQQCDINNLFVQPAASDIGVSLGAALELHAQLGNNSKIKLEHVYYGPSYGDEEITQALKNANLKFERIDDITSFAAHAIADGKIVGWFQGRMEFGPRALGNRSILANPCIKGMDDTVNLKIKFREKWRPFCPSLANEAREEYLENAHESPFMILTFNVPKKKQKEIPSVVHIDGTARPQTVTKQQNPLYYKLIKDFEKLSGTPVLMNTSFNVKGDTIVCNPNDAIRTYLCSGMDILVLGNYVVREKKEAIMPKLDNPRVWKALLKNKQATDSYKPMKNKG